MIIDFLHVTHLLGIVSNLQPLQYLARWPGIIGWNDKELSSAALSVSGPFWAGNKEFSSTRPFGVDTSDADEMSYYSNDEWTSQTPISGDLMYRVVLDDVGGGGTECNGDITGDGEINVLDVVSLVNIIMGN